MILDQATIEALETPNPGNARKHEIDSKNVGGPLILCGAPGHADS